MRASQSLTPYASSRDGVLPSPQSSLAAEAAEAVESAESAEAVEAFRRQTWARPETNCTRSQSELSDGVPRQKSSETPRGAKGGVGSRV